MALTVRDTLLLSLNLWICCVLRQKSNSNAVAAFQIQSSIKLRSVTLQQPLPYYYHTFSLHAKKDAKVPFFATETTSNSTSATAAAGVAGVGGTLTAARTVTTAGTIAATAGTAATTTTTATTATSATVAATATATAAGSSTTASVGSVGGSIAAARTVTTAGTIAATAASSTASTVAATATSTATVTATATATTTAATTAAASTAASTAGRVAIGGVTARGAAAGTTAAVVSSSSGTATTTTATAAATASTASRVALTGATVTAVSSNTATTATGTATAAGVASRGASATAIAGSKIVAARGATTAATGIAIADMAADGSLAVGMGDALTGSLAGSEVLLADATAGAGVEAWSGLAGETLELLSGAEDILLGDSALDAAAAIGADGLEAIELEAVGSGLSGMGDAILVAMGDVGLGLVGMLPGWLLSGGLMALMGELVFALIAFLVMAKAGVQAGAGVVNKGGEVLKDAVFNVDNNDSDKGVESRSRPAKDGAMALELHNDQVQDGSTIMMEEAVMYTKLNKGMEMPPSTTNSNRNQEGETKGHI